MKNFKKIKLLSIGLISSACVMAQQPPTNNNPSGNASGTNDRRFWSRAGNTNANGNNNIFGTMWDSPIYTYTAGINRMVVNGTNVNYAGIPTPGYIGIGFNPTDIRSRLTITGTNNTTFGGGGYRSWMKTGVFNLENSDQLYIGMKPEGNNRSDAVLAFGDDNGGTPFNNFRILFTNPGQPNDDHLEIARYTATGNIGFGPVFTNNTQPMSLLHLNRNNRKATWLQITNQNYTGQTAQDGLRFGIRNGNNASSYLRWQENTPFIIQTDWNAGAGGINAGERMRITTINAPGVPNPAPPFINNTTRVAISHQGSSPITAPRSLLHLGYNTGGNSIGGNSTDGWRPWMDIGTFTNNGTDNMYVGLKRETGAFPANDRQDAVINWGDNNGANPFNGPDNLRFIFTQTTTGQGNTPPANGIDGLEVARMVPNKATTLAAPNYGMMGIGNFYNAGIQPVDAKLDIDGDLRIRQVTQNDALNMVLVADPNDLNRVHWRDASTLGGATGPGFVTADNGLSINGTNNVQLGNDIGSTTAQLLNDREIPMNNFDIAFTDATVTPGGGRISIGRQLSPTFRAKLTVHNEGENIGLFVRNQNTANNIVGNIYGINTVTIGPSTGKNYGVFSSVSGANTGSFGIHSTGGGSGGNNFGGFFWAANGTTNTGLFAYGTDFAATFQGNVNVNGTLFTTNGGVSTSDNIFKTNQQLITNATSIINQLAPKTYNLDSANYTQFGFDTKQHMGLIAQEVELVLPELVSNSVFPAQHDSLGNQTHAAMNYKGLNYQQFIPLLIAGMQEQQRDLTAKDSVINSLASRLTALEKCMTDANICNTNAKVVTDDGNEGQTIELSNVNAIILDQNLPNPFAEKTTINYVIPDDVMEAQLLFSDMNGRIIKQVDINERGEGKITVYGENLQKGIYTYSLIADGKLIATKKMVKQ